jgi:lipoprotein-releasing system permease protein
MENRASALQIKLKDYRDAPAVVKELKQMFPRERGYYVETWEDKQGTILAAIAHERGLLNVLLFLIIGVAGFGILAIFAMIVAEKKRDIGILKALGASNGGVLHIFIGYALLLGLVGAGLGTILGLTLTYHLNQIEHLLTRLTGEEMFPRSVYYFDQIPTNIQPWMVVWVNLGAVGIAVIFSVLPALRAAMLQPVQALRYE